MSGKQAAAVVEAIEEPPPGGPAFSSTQQAGVLIDTASAPERAWPWWVAGLGLAATIASLIQILADRREQGVFVLVSCYVVCIAAAWIDAAMRKVPNLLTYPALLFGLAVNCVLVPILTWFGATTPLAWLGSPGPSQSGWGFMLCAGFGIISFMSRGLGGGDVKLLAAVGAIIGLSAVIPVLFNTLVIAAVVGILNWALRGELVSRIQIVTLGLLQFAATRRGIAKVYPFQPREAPFCLSLLLGLITSQFFAVHEVILRLMRA